MLPVIKYQHLGNTFKHLKGILNGKSEISPWIRIFGDQPVFATGMDEPGENPECGRPRKPVAILMRRKDKFRFVFMNDHLEWNCIYWSIANELATFRLRSWHRNGKRNASLFCLYEQTMNFIVLYRRICVQIAETKIWQICSKLWPNFQKLQILNLSEILESLFPRKIVAA